MWHIPNPMFHIHKPLNVTSPLKNNFKVSTLSIYTIQTIKYHYLIFSLFQFKIQISKFFKWSFPSYFFSYPNKHHFLYSLSSIPSKLLFLFIFLTFSLTHTNSTPLSLSLPHTLSRKPQPPSMKSSFFYLLSSFSINFGLLPLK
jgi:hypothetical protein